jgi:hypothetical protein
MSKKSILKAGIAMVWSLLLTGSIMAQESVSSGSLQKPQPRGEERMSMAEMMQQCRRHCQETMNYIDQMAKMMQEASQSNDPAKMRSALEQAQKPLAQMRERMNRCIDMMSMMQSMHGGTGGMMSGQADQQGSSSASAVGSGAVVQPNAAASCCPPP